MSTRTSNPISIKRRALSSPPLPIPSEDEPPELICPSEERKCCAPDPSPMEKKGAQFSTEKAADNRWIYPEAEAGQQIAGEILVE